MLILVSRRLQHPSAYAKAPAHASACRPSSSGGPCGWCFEGTQRRTTRGWRPRGCSFILVTTIRQRSGRPLGSGLTAGQGHCPQAWVLLLACLHGPSTSPKRRAALRGISAEESRRGAQAPPQQPCTNTSLLQKPVWYLGPKEGVLGDFFHPLSRWGCRGSSHASSARSRVIPLRAQMLHVSP